MKLSMKYPTNEEIRKSILAIKGLSIEEETNDYILVWDDFSSEDAITDRFIYFNKRENNIANLIETDEDIQSLGVIDFLKTLPDILFMNIKKIYFVRTEEQLDALYEEEYSPNHNFSLEHLGMFIWADGTIIISIPAHEKASEEVTREDFRVLGHSDYEKTLKTAIFQTLAHELYHSLQANPLFKDEVEQGEDAAEDYCRQLFN